MDKARTLLLKLGIRSTLKGFHFLLYAMQLCLSDDMYLLSVYKHLYVDVAAHFGTTRDNVDHCIRTAISNCWYKGNRELFISIAGYELKQKPANGEFIDILYNYLCRKGQARTAGSFLFSSLDSAIFNIFVAPICGISCICLFLYCCPCRRPVVTSVFATELPISFNVLSALSNDSIFIFLLFCYSLL